MRLWKKMPNNGTWADFEILDTPNEKFYYYNVADKKIPTYCIYHPSTPSFSYEYSKYLKEALRLSGFDI